MNTLIIGNKEHLHAIIKCAMKLGDETVVMVKDDQDKPIGYPYDLKPMIIHEFSSRGTIMTDLKRKSADQAWKKAWKK